MVDGRIGLEPIWHDLARISVFRRGENGLGLIEIDPFMQGAPTDAHVGAMMRPLSEENLIGADASVLDFVRDANYQKCRLVVSAAKRNPNR